MNIFLTAVNNGFKLDSTITISIVLAIVALLAPSLTAIINNRHVERMKDKEIRSEMLKSTIVRTTQAYENFLHALGKVYATRKNAVGYYTEYIEYRKQSTIISLHVSDGTKRIIDELSNYLELKDFDHVLKLLPDITLALRTEIQVLEDKE